MKALTFFLIILVLTKAKAKSKKSDNKTSLDSCSCGWINKGRIVGGKETLKNEYPLMAAILNQDKIQFCGGTILTPGHVLTAAHCTINRAPKKVFVRVGVHDLRLGEGIVHKVSKIINHENYDEQKLENDISLIETKSKMKFETNIGPVCMPSERLSLAGQYVKALGWGNVEHNGAASPVLKGVTLKGITFQTCSNIFSVFEVQPREETNMCTYSPKGDTCQGDSGGPVLWINPNTRRATLAGLVSYGGACGGGLPSVNTDVSAYIDWINTAIAGTKWKTSVCIKE